MKDFFTYLLILSFASCIPPGKLTDSLEVSSKLTRNRDSLRSILADSLASFRLREIRFEQRLRQLDDSISVVVNACAESQTQSIVTATLSIRTDHVIYFDFDKFTLVDSSFNVLSNVVDFLQLHNDYSCILQGYTDLEGPQEYNLRLSEKRVYSARNYLLSYGISANRIMGSFFGEAFVHIQTRDRESNWRNRRVEIFLKRKE